MSLRKEHGEEIKEMKAMGMTYQEIADVFTVSTVSIYYVLHPDKVPKSTYKYIKNSLKKLKVDAIDILGGKCARCGFSDIRALQIDHINGDGAEKRKQGENSYTQRKFIVEHPKDAKTEYQVLCANCNWIKRFENGETR